MSRGPGRARLAIALAGLLGLAACTAPKPAPSAPVPPPPPPQAVAPPPPVVTEVPDWRDAPLTPGTWSWAHDARGSVALFGPRGGDALFVVRCDAAQRRISLSRRDATPPGGAAMLAVTTSFGTRALPAAPVAGAAPAYLGAALDARDPLLDRIAFSRGRIRIEARGLPILLVPIWAEVGRVVEDCRG